MLLKDINCSIEQYATSYVDEIYTDIKEFSEMTYQESCFLNGFVRYFKPKKILEVGVAAGASTCVLLNALKDNSEAILHSVDWSKKYYKNFSKTSGWKAQELFHGKSQWKLHLGVDVAEIIEDQIKGNIDFLLLDTVHKHPAETLNFLSVFPYLNRNAIVVLHDVNLFFKPHHPTAYATKILFDTVVADKVTLSIFENDYIHPNIAAFQINEDTNKYIGDVVRSLFFSWGTKEPARILQATGVILKAKYCNDIYKLYERSVKQNQIHSQLTFKKIFLRINSALREILKMFLPSSVIIWLRTIQQKLKI